MFKCIGIIIPQYNVYIQFHGLYEFLKQGDGSNRFRFPLSLAQNMIRQDYMQCEVPRNKWKRVVPPDIFQAVGPLEPMN